MTVQNSNIETLSGMLDGNPKDIPLIKSFYKEFESIPQNTLLNSLKYWKLKYLFTDDNWEALSQLAFLYLTQGKKSISRMCALESLRINPSQSNLFLKCPNFEHEKYSYGTIAKNTEDSKVSVIMATYNRNELIRESIESVLNQKYENFELIVINDGGSDEAEKIINSFNSKKIRYSKLLNNIGHAGALNHGIKLASGKYIAYLDDDDIYYTDHLDRCVSFLENHLQYDVCYANAWWSYGEFREGKFFENKKKIYDYRPTKFSKKVLFNSNFISTLNIVHKRECFSKTGLFNTEMVHLFDWDLWVRFSRYFNFAQLNEMTGEYRWKTDNMSVVNNLDIDFLGKLLKGYYLMDNGKVGLAKAQLSNHYEKEFVKTCNELVLDYDFIYDKTFVFMKEISSLIIENPRLRLYKTKFIICRDFIISFPKAFIKTLGGKIPFWLAVVLLVYLPHVVIKKLFEKIKNVYSGKYL